VSLPDTRRDGPRYRVSAEERAAFERDGWVVLRGLIAPDELSEIERFYERFLRREIRVPGRDFCDMTADYGRPIEEFSIVNVMLPRRWHPPLAGNLYERRAADVAAQLCGAGLELDYDQLVAKPPRKTDAVFHWHQDLAYWPVTPDTRTASFWLALDETDVENGCVQFVSGSHREERLRTHAPLHGDREKSHTLVATLAAGDSPQPARLQPGDVSVHHERTLHGSGGNASGRWRRGYVVAFRAKETIAAERALGFTHSHEDRVDVLRSVGREG
jgi:phytanoyl-CoA hydroxylase